MNAVILIASLAFGSLVSGYSSGAPMSRCDTMVPGHGTASLLPSPFAVVPKQLNGSVEINLQSQSPGVTFKGYFVMGFDEAGNVVGSFSIDANALNCLRIFRSAATHSNPEPKSNVSLMWIPPPAFTGTVTFKSTFVKDYTTYWLKVSSPAINITATEEPTTTISPPPTTSPATTTSQTPISDVYYECGVTKGCFGSPARCVKKKKCSMMTTFTKVDDTQFQIELYADQTSADQYVALAFAERPEMGNDIVIECVNFNSEVKAHKSLNSPRKYNSRQADVDGFHVTRGYYRDGVLYCLIVVNSSLTAGNSQIDLLTNRTYLLLARGPSGESNIRRHEDRESSALPVDLADNSIVGQNDISLLKKIHGSLMITAWLLASSVGMLFPRYMKNTWVGQRWMGKDRWFLVHQGLMSLCWLLTCTGFVVIFIDLRGWVSLSIAQEPHPLIGCITTGLAFIQPFMAFVRPLPSSPNRVVFNWAHRCVGYSAHLLAIVCIFLAVDMEAAQLPAETYWILGVHVITYVLVHCWLSVMMYKNQKSDTSSQEPLPSDETGSVIRKSCVGAYSLCAVACAVAVIIFIAFA